MCRRRSFLWALLFGVVLALVPERSPGQDVTVQAYVSATTVGAQERVTYTLEIEGAAFSDVEAPSPPETEGLALLQPVPSTQSNLSFINGVQRQSVAFQWTYRPLRVGTARIKPVGITVQERFHRTEEITVEVVPQSQRTQRGPPGTAPYGRRPSPSPPEDAAEEEPESRIGAEDIFIRALPSQRSAFQNEQVTIEYQLLFRPFIRPRESRLASSWDAEGFWREDLPVEGRPIPRAIVSDGLRYNTIVLKRVAVFPARSGELRIDPLRVETEVLAMQTTNDPFGRLFSMQHPFETVELASPSVTVEARPLPSGAPEAFTGAVGRFDVDTRLSRTTVPVGEGVDVVMRVRGMGNLAMLEPPAFDVPTVFETYGPRVTTALDSTSGRVRGTKTFTYTLVPRSNGTFDLPALAFALFDPRTERYHTTTSGPMTVRVTGTAEAVTIATTGEGLPVDDIAGLMEAATWRPLDRTPLHRSAWTYLALALPLLLLGATYAYRQHRTHLARNPALARRRQAHPLAQKHLQQADALRADGRPEAFFEEVERAVLGFIGNRLDLAERGLTRDQLDAHLAAHTIGADTRAALRTFLDTCDRVRFSPSRATQAQMADALDQAQDLIIAVDDALQPDEEAA
jgi:hypothetical protein